MEAACQEEACREVGLLEAEDTGSKKLVVLHVLNLSHKATTDPLNFLALQEFRFA